MLKSLYFLLQFANYQTAICSKDICSCGCCLLSLSPLVPLLPHSSYTFSPSKMGCCCSHEPAPHAEYTKDQVGPMKKRSCHDVLFLLLFIVFWAGMFYVAHKALQYGNPERYESSLITILSISLPPRCHSLFMLPAHLHNIFTSHHDDTSPAHPLRITLRITLRIVLRVILLRVTLRACALRMKLMHQ